MMTPVEFHFVTPEGVPISDAEVEIQLLRSAFDIEDSGVLMPRPVIATTDEDGKVVVDLWSTTTMYQVRVLDTESAAGLFYKFYVPEIDVPGTVVRLQDIVVTEEMQNTSFVDAILVQVQTARTNAVSAQIAAQAAASQAVSAAQSTGADAASALASKNAAGASATSASESAATATTKSIVASEGAATATSQASIAVEKAEQASATVPVFSEEAPEDPIPGGQWIDATTGRRFTWLVRDNHGQWVETGAAIQIGYETAVVASLAASRAEDAKAAAEISAVAATTRAQETAQHWALTLGLSEDAEAFANASSLSAVASTTRAQEAAESLVESLVAVEQAKDNKDLAKDWANKTNGEVVEGQGHSSKFYAQNAATSALEAQAVYNNVQTINNAAAEAASQAQNSATLSEEAKTTAVEAADLATTKADEAWDAARYAEQKKLEIDQLGGAVTVDANRAEIAATAAEQSESTAEQHKIASSLSAQQASSSESQAGQSAQTAQTAANQAQQHKADAQAAAIEVHAALMPLATNLIATQAIVAEHHAFN